MTRECASELPHSRQSRCCVEKRAVCIAHACSHDFVHAGMQEVLCSCKLKPRLSEFVRNETYIDPINPYNPLLVTPMIEMINDTVCR